MQDDLIFHITTKNKFDEFKTDNNYHPESLEEEGFIHCSTGEHIEATANRLFAGEEQLLLLIINISTLRANVKHESDPETGKKYPHIYGPLNTDAIMDKLTIFPEENGAFKIAFTSKT